MADAGLHVMALAAGAQQRAEIMGGEVSPTAQISSFSPSTVNNVVRLIARGSTLLFM